MSSPPDIQFTSALARHSVEIFRSVWLLPIDIMRASIRMALALALKESFLKSPSKIRGTKWVQWWYEFLGVDIRGNNHVNYNKYILVLEYYR
jgi:hypothetical protein